MSYTIIMEAAQKMDATLAEITRRDREIQHLIQSQAILSWDQETYMPAKAIEGRAAQLALLETIVHRRIVDDGWERLFETVGVDDAHPQGSDQLDEYGQALMRRLWRRYRRAIRLPAELVARLAEAASKGQALWQEARKRKDFDYFAPQLGYLVDLTREVSDRLGYDEHPYDPLLDQFEPWMKTATVRSLFADLQRDLTALIERIRSKAQVDDALVRQSFPTEDQRRFCDQLIAALGYDLRRGRLDISAHPFTTTLGADDVRITTRLHEHFLPTGIFGTIHETGHALYELGIDARYHGTVLGDGTSLGIHESQSRLWENFIGKSRPFWNHFFPSLQRLFPDRLTPSDDERLYRIFNRVEPSFIRIDADEVTYSLHIILRFNLELALVERQISVADLPEVWRVESRNLLGIDPVDVADGVLQDIHWSMGAFGYFPTYALGNLYAAQFLQSMRRDLPNFDRLLASGEFAPIGDWLRRHIHSHGSAPTAEELCKRATGEPLRPRYFIDYLNNKFSEVYGL